MANFFRRLKDAGAINQGEFLNSHEVRIEAKINAKSRETPVVISLRLGHGPASAESEGEISVLNFSARRA
ncbi:MAG: hypothetical protein EOP11_09660 [Proteobacteria bacterium]|nr:MAG: hypothetical protein EOP11_09660 [Pseudomonadota bacterium]